MADLFDTLHAQAALGRGPLLDTLAASLRERGRWHALFDLRLLEARAAIGLPLSGDLGTIDEKARAHLDERSLAACREVGWPLLDEGAVAAGWMYLRAVGEQAEVARKLRTLAACPPAAIDDPANVRQEIVHVALWEGIDPALGLELVLADQGTCNAVTAYEQAVSRLPAVRQQEAAAVLVSHLYHEVAANLAADIEGRGLVTGRSVPASIDELLAAAGGLTDDPSVHVDVSHLQSVLRIARVVTNHAVIHQAWELATYACRLPADVCYPGEPPFENVGETSRLFFGAQLGVDIDTAVRHFRTAAAMARMEESGTLPTDILVLLLWRLNRPAEALHAALQRPADGGMPSVVQATGMLPSLIELATAADALDVLRSACRDRGDEITFAATLL